MSREFGNDGLKASDREMIRGVLSQFPAVEKAVLFGSRATGTYSAASDIDLVLYGESLTLSDESRIASKLEDTDLPFRVDLVRYATITSKALLDHIRRDGKLFYEVAGGRGKAGLGSSDMEGDWETVALEDLIEPRRGISYGIVQPGAAVPDGVPIVRVSDVRNGRIATAEPLRVAANIEAAYKRTRLAGGELLLTLVGTVGETAVVPEALAGWNTARAIAVIPVRKEIGAYWVQMALRAPGVREIINSRLNTTVQATLNLGDVAHLPIVLPPSREREAIAQILGTLDDKIELNRRMNETLEAMAQALFKSWFVDFEPVRAKAEGRDPGLPRQLADLFPDSFEDSELGEIPQGWKVGSLGEVAWHPRRGVMPEEIDPSTPYIALEHMPRRCIALSDWGIAAGLESNKFEFKEGEILFGKLRPYFHKVGVAPVDGVCSTDIVVVAPREGKWFGFVLGHVSSEAFVEYTNAGSTGTKMPRTSWDEMARYRVALPDEAVAKAFTGRVRPFVARLIASIHQSRTLTALRDTLLPKLLSGELRVKDAERRSEGIG